MKRSGTIFKGLSPFNSEKTPSFVVYPDSQIFKCYSSGHAGDLYRFVQLKENLNFPESIEWIAERYKIHLEYEKGEGSSAILVKEQSLRKRLLEVHKLAATYFHDEFMKESEESQYIRDYWTNDRSFTIEVAKELIIGYAKSADQELRKWLSEKGYSDEDLITSGLFYGKANQKLYPRFEGRLMIPIRDIQGRVIAFTARQTERTPDSPSSDAKYINSPETPIFQKSKVMFGLERARNYVTKYGSFLMVEGQLDAIRCWSVGINNAVAPQGTAITEDQLALMKRYSPDFVECLLDGDSAGVKAALRVIPLGFKVGLDMSFTSLQEGEDPDEILKRDGKEALESRENRAMDPVQFLLQVRVGQKKLSPGELENLCNELYGYLVHIESEVKIGAYLKRCSDILKVNYDSLHKDFIRFSNKNKRRMQVRKPDDSVNSVKQTNKNLTLELTTIEYVLLFLLLHHEELQEHLAQVINPEWINSESVYGRILHRILLQMQEGLWEGVKGTHELLEEDVEKDAFFSILAEKSKFEEPVTKANQCLKDLFSRFLKDQEDILRKKSEEPGLTSQDSLVIQEDRIKLRSLKKRPPQLEFIVN